MCVRRLGLYAFWLRILILMSHFSIGLISHVSVWGLAGGIFKAFNAAVIPWVQVIVKCLERLYHDLFAYATF